MSHSASRCTWVVVFCLLLALAGCASVTGPTCTDGLTNGLEVGVDCGGPECAACGAGQPCVDASDCLSGECLADICSAAVCGDGRVNDPSEVCDDGGETATCDDDCTPASCGDGVINATAGEVCDDGGESASCDVDCTAPSCGDGTVNMSAGETCDDSGESATCDVDCTPAACGDGTLNGTSGETCDDGNVVDGDGCSASCQLECQPAVFTTSGAEPNCWCAQDTSTTTVTVAGWAEVITNSSVSTNVSCNSCPVYTTSIMWLDVGVHTLTSQAVPCDCNPSSLVLNGVFAVTGVCGP